MQTNQIARCKLNILFVPYPTQKIKLIGWEIHSYVFKFTFSKLTIVELLVTLNTNYYIIVIICKLWMVHDEISKQVAPLEIHQEDMEDVEEQVRFLLNIIKGVEISCLFSLLKGSISCWIWRCLGVQVSALFWSKCYLFFP